MKRAIPIVVLLVAVALLLCLPPTTPTPSPVPVPPAVSGLGAFVVDVPDDYVKLFGQLLQTRQMSVNGWDLKLADDCVFSIKGNKLIIGGGVSVKGHVMAFPVNTSVNSLTFSPGRITVDLYGSPIDVVLK